MLTQAIVIFVCQFVLIFLMGIQSQLVRDGRIMYAAITSLLLGVMGWSITGIISSAYGQGMLSVVFFSFILAGPAGIASSIYIHQRFKEEGM